jgi:hypothetical protein
MKGFSLQNGVELRIEVEGESWSQGDRISFRLTGKKEDSMQVSLAVGLDKKVKAKSPDAFEILATLEQRGTVLENHFQLPCDCRITDKSGSLHLLYGIGNPSGNPAHLRLTIDPHVHIRDVCGILTDHFRFTRKSIVAGKNKEVEIKFDPSGAKEWASLETLALFTRITESGLSLRFVFERKEINVLKTALTAQTVKRTLERTFPLTEVLHDFNRRLDTAKMTALIEGIFADYRLLPKPLGD